MNSKSNQFKHPIKTVISQKQTSFLSEPLLIQSRDNPLFKQLRLLCHDNAAYKKQNRVWLEGDHLCRAALTRGFMPSLAIFSASFDQDKNSTIVYEQLRDVAIKFNSTKDHFYSPCKIIVLSDALFKDLSALASPAAMGFVLDLPSLSQAASTIAPFAPSVILDGLQDVGNVGSILRSAGAFGFSQILAMKGTAALWSPKVLRSAMGAHFGLRLFENVSLDDLQMLQIPLLATSSHQGQSLQNASISMPCAWILGHEGQGVSAPLMEKAAHFVKIPQPSGEESLNVAAAAAICLYASSCSITLNQK